MESKFAPLLNLSADLMKALNKVENYQKFCQTKLGECDRALSDIDHLIELTKLDAVKMVRAVGKRKDILQERRFYKDEVARADIIMKTMSNSQTTHGELTQVAAKLKEFDEQVGARVYTPRVLFDIFGYDADTLQSRQDRRQDLTKLGKKASKKALRMEEAFRKI